MSDNFYYIVYDNFLDGREFGIFKHHIEMDIAYNLTPKINSLDENSQWYLAQMLYIATTYCDWNGGWNNMFPKDPLLLLLSKIHMQTIIRVKANMYPRSRLKKVEPHAKHQDYIYDHQGALFYTDECDAPTTLADGTQIESKANRLLLFNPATPHSSSSPTDKDYRFTVNINYFGMGVKKGYLREHLGPPTMAHNPPKGWIDEYKDMSDTS